MTNQEVIEAFRTSNQRVLRLAYYDMKDKFTAFISKHCSPLDESSIEDVYHSSLIELQQNILYSKLTEEKLASSLQTYLNSIGYNVAMNLLRKQRFVYVGEPEVSPVPPANPMQLIINNENFQIIRKTVSDMGKPCAPILLAYYWNNMKMELIAKRLGYSNADSVKNQKARCMSKLKEYIKNQITDYGNDY